MTWLANVFVLIGLWMAGNKNRYAFLFTIIGEAIWTIMSALRSQWDLAVICFIFTVLACVNWWKWSRPEAEKVS